MNTPPDKPVPLGPPLAMTEAELAALELPPEQAAIDAVTAWLANPRGPQVLRLFGFAGTGKTTLAIHLASLVRGPVVFAAYTGKAALVMRKKGCTGASTQGYKDGKRSAYSCRNGLPTVSRCTPQRCSQACSRTRSTCPGVALTPGSARRQRCCR